MPSAAQTVAYCVSDRRLGYIRAIDHVGFVRLCDDSCHVIDDERYHGGEAAAAGRNDQQTAGPSATRARDVKTYPYECRGLLSFAASEIAADEFAAKNRPPCNGPPI